VIVRTLGTLVRRQKAVGMGAAVTASLLQVALRLGVEVRLSSPIDELITEDGRVTGVRTSRGGSPRTIAAARGVILGGGGFDHNVEWRERYQGVTGADSSGASGNVGSAIEVAMKVGAAVDLMEDAWWGGSVPSPAPAGSAMFLVSERSMPHSIIVDAAGHRFANESESYVDLGHHMFEHFQTVPGACWMITDVRHTRRYLRSYAMDPRAVKAMEAAGTMVKAPTLAALAGRIRVDAAALQATVDRFNGFCRAGVDNDFARGNSAYDRYYGDPSVHPNPNLGTIEKGPFAAVQVVPGDLGTKGGLLSDEHARVLREDGSVIEGLYVSGNNSASVMGHTYPGPGSTLGPAAVFGYIAAKHIASN
jgi:3-oxosteroid 1-dehydrogenase